jgi:selenocysteine-specific elongation factor
MIVGTAGHVDHGKSALVTALTGRTMDRLAEERRRGITIDLNFAPLELGDGRIAGMIDVPGHEDFVRTMVAGASGADAALLVVAADEGIMPQTVEHLLVLERMGVPRAIPVVTKADLVEPEWLALVLEEVAARLAASPVAFEPPIAVSVRDGRGIGALRERLTDLAARPARERDDLFRLPVDRAFPLAGVGTVVTGTCWSGSADVGAEVRVLPSGALARVRSIEVHGRSTSAAEPGARTALGLAGMHRDDAPRGSVVVLADAPWEVTRMLDVQLGLDRGTPLSRRTRLRLHHGTAEVPCWVSPRGVIAPGGTGAARLTLDRPIVARGGDRFVLRTTSPAAVVGGGTVVDPLPERRAPWMDALAGADLPARLEALVARRRAGLALSLAPVVVGLPRHHVERLVRGHAALRRLDGQIVTAGSVSAARAALVAALGRFHRERPADRGMPLETLRRAAGASDPIAEAALAGLREEGEIAVAGGLASARGFRSRVSGGDAIVAEMVTRLEAAGLAPPSVPELAQLVGRPDLPAILRIAEAAGSVEAVERDRYYSRTALEAFARAVVEAGAGGEVTVGRLRESLGLSRKFLIPLLEWSDRQGLTVRSGDTRRLRAPQPGPGAAS